MCRKIPSHWQPLFSKIMAAATSFSYKIGGGGLIFIQNWWRRQGFGNITGGYSDMVWILESNIKHGYSSMVCDARGARLNSMGHGTVVAR